MNIDRAFNSATMTVSAPNAERSHCRRIVPWQGNARGVAMREEGKILKPSMRKHDSQHCHARYGDLAARRGSRPVLKSLGMQAHRVAFQLLAAAALAAIPLPVSSQSPSLSAGSPRDIAASTSSELDPTYVRPTQRTMASNYVFDAFGPYPLVGSALEAGVNQFSNSPPEWKQGVAGYSKRFGSDFAILATGTTTRYGLAEVLREDTLYYRCECVGVLPRLRHAVFSTLTARRGVDGHRVFSFAALAAPYAGSVTAVYGWYPARFGAKDAFRIGNYSLLSYAGGNIALEFFYSGPHSLLSRMHLNNSHGSPVQGPNS